MSNIGFNPNAFAGWAPAAAAPAPGYGYGMPTPGFAFGGGFGFPIDVGFGTTAPAAAAPMERFATSMSGGVIIGKDGAPAGRVPEGSFVDLKDGAVYGPDGKKLELPADATVDLFDLPDIKQLVDDYKLSSTPTTDGGGNLPVSKYPTLPMYPSFPGFQGFQGFQGMQGQPQFTAVNGQWGPGGITDLKGGGTTPAAGCDSHHGSTTQAGGKPSVSAGGAVPSTIASLQQQLAQGLAALNGLTGMHSSVAGTFGGGATSALGGAGNLGTMPGNLQHSLNELIFTLRQLVGAMQTTMAGGHPGQGKPVVEKPTTERPSTETTSSGSGSGTSSSDTSSST